MHLQIFTAQVDFLKTVNITASSVTSGIAGVGIPLDSLRPNNVTYGTDDLPLKKLNVPILIVLLSDSNMFVTAFADMTLQRLIVSGMETHPTSNDVSLDSTTLTTWSTRSV
jgi:hypothetical protein